jgi:predicted Zn-ribbon and HTH transcriptional regulator
MSDTLECKHCKYTWIPRTAIVKACPKCKSYNWMNEPKKVGVKRG